MVEILNSIAEIIGSIAPWLFTSMIVATLIASWYRRKLSGTSEENVYSIDFYDASTPYRITGLFSKSSDADSRPAKKFKPKLKRARLLRTLEEYLANR